MIWHATYHQGCIKLHQPPPPPLLGGGGEYQWKEIEGEENQKAKESYLYPISVEGVISGLRWSIGPKWGKALILSHMNVHYTHPSIG
jgi:hypothetical protein